MGVETVGSEGFVSGLANVSNSIGRFHMRAFGKIGLGIVAVLIAATGSASASCSNSSLDGTYGFSARESSTPLASIGTFTADGAGNITSGQVTQSNNGTISSVTFSGTYTISNDCTGTITTTDSLSSLRKYFVVVSGAKKGTVALIEHNPSGLIASGDAHAQGVGVCGLTGKPQAYALHLTGFAGSAGEAIVGKFVFAGNGNITYGVAALGLGSTYSSPSHVSGTYTVNSNCAGTIQISFGGATYNFDYVAIDADKQFILLETDANTTVAGALAIE